MTETPFASSPAALRIRGDHRQGRLHALEDYLDGTPPTDAVAVAQSLADALCPPDTGRGGAPPLTRIGNYRLGRFLGQGSSGRVFAAVHESSGTPVAIKLLHAALGASFEARQRFAREIGTALRVAHTNVCRIHHGDPTGEQPYLVMDYVPGVGLDEILTASRSRGLDLADVDPWNHDDATRIDRVLSLLAATARGVAAIHAAGLVHRDLKPANIRLTPDGAPVVTDLGLVGSLDDDASSLTRDGRVGTPAYMAPEQVRGERADARTDVWALGILLHECLTTEKPFTGTTRAELEHAILHSPARVPVTGSRETDRGIGRLLTTALAKEPRHRYDGAAAFADDLGRILRGAPPIARPPTWREQAARAIQRRPLRALASGLGIALTVVSVFAIQQVRIADERARALHDFDRLLRETLAAYDEVSKLVGGLSRHGVDARERQRWIAALIPPLETAIDLGIDDPRIRAGQVRAAMTLGEARGLLGDVADARPALRRAVEGAAALVATRGKLDDRRLHAVALVKLGDLERSLGRVEAMRQHYHTAHAIHERLFDLAPADRGVLSDLASSFIRLGVVAQRDLDRDTARRLFRAAADVQDLLESHHADHPDLAADASLAYSLLAGELHANGDVADAHHALERSIEFAERLRTLAPRDARGPSMIRLARLRGAWWSDDAERRVWLAREALAAARESHRLATADLQASLDLASTESALGKYLALAGDGAAATRHLEQSIAAVDKVLAAQPDHAEAQIAAISLRLEAVVAGEALARQDLVERHGAAAMQRLRSRLADPHTSSGVRARALRMVAGPRARPVSNIAEARHLMNLVQRGPHATDPRVRQAIDAVAEALGEWQSELGDDVEPGTQPQRPGQRR